MSYSVYYLELALFKVFSLNIRIYEINVYFCQKMSCFIKALMSNL